MDLKDTSTTTPVIADTAQDFDAVFAEITGDTHDEQAGTSTEANDGASSTPSNDGQPGEPGDGAGDSGQPAEAGGDAAAADGEGQPADGDGDADRGDQSGEGQVDYAAQIAALEARLAAAETKSAPAQAQSAPAPELYTPEEKVEIDTLKGDWPDIFRMVTLLTRQTEANVVNYTFSELGKVLGPLQQTVSTITGNDHLDAIYSAHDDYDAVYQPCMDWIEKQPSFIKKACKDVVANGTAEEVNTMIQRFKDETKWKAAKPATGVVKTTELSNAAKQAAQAISAVGTKRGAMPSAQDPTDFDAAWNEANAT